MLFAHTVVRCILLLPYYIIKVLGLSPKIVFGQKMRVTGTYVAFFKVDGINAM